jgi:hypothetical protein
MDADMGSGKTSSSAFSTPLKMARATDSGEDFGMSKLRGMSVSTGLVRAACTLTPRPASGATAKCRHRQNVDDRSPRTSQQPQEGLGHAKCAEEVDGEVPFDYGTLAEVVIVKRQAGIIDEDIERLDCLDSCLNLRRVGHVQGQGRDTPIPVGQGLARTRVHPLAASPHGPLDQRLPDAAIGASNQNCSGCDLHALLLMVAGRPRTAEVR